MIVGCFFFLNNNLPQEMRVKKEHLMITLVIPGPKQPQDFNSFLYPLIQEMKILQGIFFIHNTLFSLILLDMHTALLFLFYI